VLTVVSIYINLRVGSCTCEIKIEIAFTAMIEGVCIAVFSASITKFILWLDKRKGVVWVVEGVLFYRWRQVKA
jgi:hypothetical protein